MRRFVQRLIFLAFLLGWAEGSQAQTRVDGNIVYGMYSGLAPLMDVHYPVLLLHGDADEVVPIQQSQSMETALKEVGVPVKLVSVPGSAHKRNFGLSLDAPDWELTLWKQSSGSMSIY